MKIVPNDLASESEVTFQTDGAVLIESAVGPIGNFKVRVVDTGTWALKGDLLHIRISSIKWHVDGASETRSKQIDERIKKDEAKMIEETNRYYPVRINWNGPNMFSYEVGEKSFELVRIQ